MKKATLLFALAVAAMSFNSCDWTREQTEKDATTQGKAKLNEARYSRKAMVETAKAMAESSKLDAVSKITKAKSDAEATIINARAEAAARIMGAESKAKANKMLNSSITPALIDYLHVERWNGQLPTTIAGPGVNTIIGVK